MKIKERFIDPFTDFGFKKLFGSDPSRDLLIDFLNELLDDHKQIKSLTYSRNEHFGKTSENRKAVFDLYCENENGEKFIIELQKAKQQYFKDRSIYYATFPIQEQALKGDNWNYQLNEIYTISIMDFAFDDSNPHQYQHEVKLVETSTKEIFYDKLTFIYLEMSKFVKSETELVTHFDKWLYLLKNLNQFQEIPSVLQERIFRKVFEVAEVSNLNEEEMKIYEASLKDKRDWKNVIDTAKEEGIKLGELNERKRKDLEIAERNKKIAGNLKKAGVEANIIAEATGLSLKDIEKL